MALLAKILPIALLGLHLASADQHEEDESSNDLGLRFYDLLEMRADARKSIENFALLSRNNPSRMTFKFPGDDSKKKIVATIERMYADDKTAKCSFEPFDDELATYNIKLWSMKNNIEMLEAIKMFKEPKDNAMDLFVMNMTDCKFTKTTIMKGYDFLKYRGTFMILNPWEDKYFEIFSLNGKEECGSYMCKRTYWMENRTMSEPMRFELLNEKQDWRLTFMAKSSDSGYFSLIRQKMAIKLLSLMPDGKLINAKEDKIDSKLRFLRISTANDGFGACYIEEEKPKTAQCMLLDRKLETKINKSMSLDEETSYMAMYNLPKGGFILMTAWCADGKDAMLEKKKERCDSYNMRMIKFMPDSSFSELMMLKEESCAPRRRMEFQFYEQMDTGKLCMYYACDCKDGAICDDMLRSKCLGDLKEL